MIRILVLFTLFSITVSGCASFGESAQSDTMTQNVGVYAPPAPGQRTAKAGVPKFTIQGNGTSAKLEAFAAEQLSTLLFQTRRFQVIERSQLQQLLNEKGLVGIEKTAATEAPVSAVEYLVVGSVTNLRIKKQKAKRGLSLGNIPIPGVSRTDSGFSKEDVEIISECGVDLRVLDAGDGTVVAAHFGEFKRVDSASALGIRVMGASTNAQADIQINDDTRGKVLRLALDEALRKMLPDIDRALSTP